MLPLTRRLACRFPGGRRLLHTSPPANSGVLASRLASRAVVRFRGPEAARFLNSLLTNDILSHSPSSAQPQRYAPTPNAPARAPPPQYAALLTPQGRFLYDLFLYRPAPRSQMLDRTGSAPQTGERPGGEEEGDGEVLADVDAAEVDELLACFKRQLECEGHQAQDHRHWKDEVHAPRASQVQEQLQRRVGTKERRMLRRAVNPGHRASDGGLSTVASLLHHTSRSPSVLTIALLAWE